MRRQLAILSIAAILGWGADAFAQELENEAGSDVERTIFFVPRLGGALSVDASVAYRFRIGNDDGLPSSTIGGSIGYRHFFDWHGKLSLRSYGSFRYGGLGSAAIDGEVWQFGGGLSLHARGYSDRWAFGGIGVFTEVLGTTWQPPTGTSLTRDSESGWQWSGGLETDFGQLIFADPYLFAESSALFGLNYIDVGPWTSWSIDARWVVRFDWAWRPSVDD